MTLDYIINPCTLARNSAGGHDLQAYRKAILGQLFVLFLIYFAGQIYKTIMSRRYIQLKQIGQNPEPLRLPWNQKHWNRTFPVIFANNAIAIGFVLLFSPTISGLVLSYVHLIGVIIHIVGQLQMRVALANIGLTFASVMNLSLIFNGLIMIKFANYEVDGVCKYQYNNW